MTRTDFLIAFTLGFVLAWAIFTRPHHSPPPKRTGKQAPNITSLDVAV